jgi:hypothetical protein
MYGNPTPDWLQSLSIGQEAHLCLPILTLVSLHDLAGVACMLHMVCSNGPVILSTPAAYLLSTAYLLSRQVAAQQECM